MYNAYQVKPGETLESIAGQFNVKPDEIVSMNGLVGGVRPGQLIVVPGGQQSMFDTYIVKQGDNMYEIAKRYNVSVDDLLMLNGLEKDAYIYPNQELLVPRPGMGIYVTRENDTINSVVNRLGISPADLIRRNENIYLTQDQLIIYNKNRP